MAASDHLNKILFHGTGGEINGGVVRPGEEGRFGPGAYATDKLSEAESYAAGKAQDEGRLFGTVYEVSPASDDFKTYDVTEDWREHNPNVPEVNYVVDQKGLKVKKAVSYPINESAVHKPYIPPEDPPETEGPILG
jgi:hypothetical protein